MTPKLYLNSKLHQFPFKPYVALLFHFPLYQKLCPDFLYTYAYLHRTLPFLNTFRKSHESFTTHTFPSQYANARSVANAFHKRGYIYIHTILSS